MGVWQERFNEISNIIDSKETKKAKLLKIHDILDKANSFHYAWISKSVKEQIKNNF